MSNMGTRHGRGTAQAQGQNVAAAHNMAIGHALLEARVAEEDEGDEDLNVEPEPLEPPQLEDGGDSAAFVEDSPPGTAFDRAWDGSLPLVKQLPRRLRPPVRYRIDRDLKVHALFSRRSGHEELEGAVADAIAEHLRRCGAVLEGLGDWARIPAIGKDQHLEDLIEAIRPGLLADGQFHSLGNVLKDFAIELPNRDVVIPQVLIEAARQGKLSTRAAALRAAVAGTSEPLPCGERWSAAEWKGFNETQQRASRRRTRKGDEP